MRLSGQFQISFFFLRKDFARKKGPKHKQVIFTFLEVFVCAKIVAFIV